MTNVSIKRLAIVHNTYGKLSGEETVVENLAALLEGRGVSVCRFSRSSTEIEDRLPGKMAAFFSGIHNPFSSKKFERFLKEKRPDVVHIHNLYPLISPSILPVCKDLGVPVVMTVHNFRLVCPNGLLMSKGEICHRCLGGREYQCVLRNCEDSIFKSTGYALRTAAARMLRRYYDNVDHFICLSEFQKNILVGEGLPADRVSVLANPMSFDVKMDPRQVHSGMTEGGALYKRGELTGDMKMDSPGIPRHTPGVAAGLRRQEHSGMTKGVPHSGMTDNWIPASVTYRASTTGMTKVEHSVDKKIPPAPLYERGESSFIKEGGGYVAYVGRISPEKDIFTLLEAARMLGDIPFKLAGDYQRMPEVLKNKPTNVEFLGQLGAKEIAEFYRNAKMVVFATRCYEGFPTVLLEAMSHGLPIVCSRIGGLPEIVEEGVNGLLYESGNVSELVARIQSLWGDGALCEKLGTMGQRKLGEKYDAERLLYQLLEIYGKVISENGSRRTEDGGQRCK